MITKKRISNLFYPKDTYFGRRCSKWFAYPNLKYSPEKGLIYRLFLAGRPCQGCSDCKPELSSAIRSLEQEIKDANVWWSILSSQAKADLIDKFFHLLEPSVNGGDWVLTDMDKVILMRAHHDLLMTATKYK